MVERASTLLEEIRQIKLQYVAEVGKGRRVWPKSIKTRIAELDELGAPAKHIAERTGVPYETVILWRYKRRRKPDDSGFHELKVAAPELPAISKSVAVTATKYEISPVPLTVTTPEGFRIEGLTEEALLRLIARLNIEEEVKILRRKIFGRSEDKRERVQEESRKQTQEDAELFSKAAFPAPEEPKSQKEKQKHVPERKGIGQTIGLKRHPPPYPVCPPGAG